MSKDGKAYPCSQSFADNKDHTHPNRGERGAVCGSVVVQSSSSDSSYSISATMVWIWYLMLYVPKAV